MKRRSIRHDSSGRDAGRSDAMPWDFADRELARVVSAWDNLSKAIFHIVLLVMFSFYFFPDARVADSFTQHQAIRTTLLTSRTHAALADFKSAVFFSDIKNARQYSDYVLNVLLPNLYDITYPTGSSIPVGAVRMRTHRVLENRCALNGDVLYGAHTKAGVEQAITLPKASVMANLVEQSCFGGLGHSTGAAAPRTNELTADVPASTVAQILRHASSFLWLTFAAHGSTADEVIDGDTAGGPAPSRPRTVHIMYNAGEDGGHHVNVTPLWVYQPCTKDAIGAPATPTLNGELRTYHCGGFHFDFPFWRRTEDESLRRRSSSGVEGHPCRCGDSASTSARDADSDSSDSAHRTSSDDTEGSGSCECAEPPRPRLSSMNDPTKVAIPYYSAQWARMPLRNASGHFRLRLQRSGSTFIDDTATRFVVTEFYLYNPTLHTFAVVKVYAEVLSGGVWLPQTQIYLLHIWTRADAGRAAYSIVFFALVVALTFRLVFVTGRRRWRESSHRVLETLLLFGLWDWLDLVAFVLLIVSGSMRAAYVARCNALHVNLSEMVYSPRYPIALDSLIALSTTQLYLNAVVTVLLFLRMAYYASRFFVPFIILTRVLTAARRGLLGVVLLFLFGLTVFGGTGHVLLGNTVAEFNTFDSSFRFFFYLLLRHVDVQEVLMQSNRHTEVVFFFWAFELVVGLFTFAAGVGVLATAFSAVDTGIGNRDEGTPVLHGWVPSSVRWVLSRRVRDKILQPSRWRYYIGQYLRGRGRGALLRKAQRQIRSYRRLRFPVRETATDAGADVLTADDFAHALLAHHGEGTGKASATEGPPAPLATFFYEDVWRYLCGEWATAKRSTAATETQRRVAWATTTVERVAGAYMETLHSLPTRLDTLEAGVTQLAGMLPDSGSVAA